MTRKELQESLALKGEDNFRKLYLTPALALGALEMRIPDRPNSRSQKSRLTNKGRTFSEVRRSSIGLPTIPGSLTWVDV